jgi:hypothetical protein
MSVVRPGIAVLLAVVLLLGSASCSRGRGGYAFRNIRLGMSLDDFRRHFPSVELTGIRIRDGSTLTLGRLKLEDFAGSSVAFGKKEAQRPSFSSPLRAIPPGATCAGNWRR